MKINNIKILSFFLFFWLFLVTSCYAQRNNSIEVIIKEASEGIMNLKFINNGKNKHIIPYDILLTGDVISFEGSSEISYNGIVVDASYPHRFDRGIEYTKKFVEQDCYLRNTKGYKILLPNDFFVLEYDLTQDYEGFKKGKEYIIDYSFNIDSIYSDFCPLIWTGVLISNKISFKFSPN